VVIGNLTAAKIKQVLADYRAGKAPDYKQLPYSTNDFLKYKQSPRSWWCWITSAISTQQHRCLPGRGGYANLKKAVTTMTPEAVVEEVKTAGIAAGAVRIPAGLKWSFTRPLTVTPNMSSATR